MTISESFSHQASNLVQSVRDMRKLSLMHYSAAERASLISALRSKGHETDLLGFHVSYLNDVAFHFVLREVFFNCDYLMDSETDSPVILDCGANIGLATLFFKRHFPRARITCFEADPTTASILRKNVEQNHLQDVSTYNLMLSDSEGEHLFYIDPNIDGSLKMSGTSGRLSNQREIKVNAGKLSHFIDGPIDLLKLDVEGAEFEVMNDLKSSGKLSHVRRMVIEYHHKIDGQASRLSKFLALLEDEGFEYQIAGKCYPITTRNTFQDILLGAYRPN